MRKINSKSAKPATVKAAAKASAANVIGTTPAVAAKPVAGAKPDRAVVIAECREAVARFYNGASLTVHAKRPCTAAAYTSVITTHTHRCGPAGTSTRDESLLCLIASRSDAKTGTFDPVTIAADLGVISRLASVGYITLGADKLPMLTTTGAERARLAAKRAA